MDAEQREQLRIKLGLLTEPDGYYSFPVVLGTLMSGTGKMEIIGYQPTQITQTPGHDGNP